MVHRTALRTGIVSLLIAITLWHPAAGDAADAPALPGFGELGKGATLSRLVTGDLEQSGPAVVRLVVERISLETSDAMDNPDDAQLISVESGNLTMTDELGLVASLGAGEHLFAEAGAYPEISADQPTALLRARLTTPENDITIADNTCTPATTTAAVQDGLTIGNTTARDQSISIIETGFAVTVPAEETVIVPIAAIPDGEWQASCGLGNDGKPIDEIALTITSTPQPDASPTPDDGTTVIFSNEISMPSADTATFFMAEVALAADGSLGKQTFTGATVVSASDQPLWFKRPRRLTSTLAAGASTVVPAGTQVTIENAGKEPATILLAGVAPAASEPAGSADSTPSKEGSSDRPVTRDEGDAATSLERYIPVDAAASSAGFDQRSVTTIISLDDSVLNALRTASVREQWQRGVRVVYDPAEGDALSFAVVNIDQLASDEAAAAAFDELAGIFTLGDETLSLPPSSDIAPEAMVGGVFGGQGDLTFCQIMVRDGNTLINLALFASDLETAKTQGLALWQLYSLKMDS